MKVSIIIPTLNEEKLLPRLLASIRSQRFTDYEIIVADAGSTDRTVALADEAGARVVRGGLPGVGRNAGARVAKGEYLFFFDADVVLPEFFLESACAELDERFIDLATCEIRPLSNHSLDLVIHRFINLSIRTSLRIDPKAFGFAIFVTARLFRRAGGFDATIRLAEDAEFVKRAAHFRPLQWLNSVHIDVSVRRFEKEGRLAHLKKGIRLNLYRIFRGEVRDDVINYRFADYDSGPETYRSKLLQRIERTLLKLERREKKTDERASVSYKALMEEVTRDLEGLLTQDPGSAGTRSEKRDE